MAYFNKDDIVKYIISKHKQVKRHEISPIKLQKSLYFLYAMWSGNASNINYDIYESNEGICEYDTKLDVDLFEPNFEAWKYGPVDRQIYYDFRDGIYNDMYDDYELSFDGIEGLQGELETFINSILEQTFEISDFSLVDMSHLDESWKRVYDSYPSGTGKMDKKEITTEYAEKLKY